MSIDAQAKYLIWPCREPRVVLKLDSMNGTLPVALRSGFDLAITLADGQSARCSIYAEIGPLDFGRAATGHRSVKGEMRRGDQRIGDVELQEDLKLVNEAFTWLD